MTALRQYERLECPAVWRDQGGGPRRDVIVSFGDATLVIAEVTNGRALAHWSLPAVMRVNPGHTPARFAPGPDSAEEIEIDDPLMVEALSKVHALIEARRPHPGRLRLVLAAGVLAALAIGAFVWVPGAIVSHAARVAPEAERDEIGQMLMTDVFRVTGSACAAPEGRAALMRLRDRLFGPDGGDLIVLRRGIDGTRLLPGGAILIGRSLVEAEGPPELLAGHVLAARARADAVDPLEALLSWAGVRAALGLLTTGRLDPDRTVGYSEVLLTGSEDPPPLDALISRFSAAGLSPAAYVKAAVADPSAAIALTAGVPAPPTTEPVLSDDDWVALQGICGD